MLFKSANSVLTRRSRSFRATGVAAVLALLAVLGATSADAAGGNHAVPAPPTAPTSANQIQNIDQVKTAIKAYYGDTVTTTLDPVSETTALHTFSPSGAYAGEMTGIEKKALKYLARSHERHASGQKAILLDIDDTTLNTYSYEIFSNFVFNPTTNAAFVNSAAFPPVPGMPKLVQEARTKGYKVFFLTGRAEVQRVGTLQNLTAAGYPVISSQVFLKDQTQPYLASCAPTCTTVQYKSLTRKLIESQGVDIVANFGDQFSDLIGGFADKTFKLPNPMYFLP